MSEKNLKKKNKVKLIKKNKKNNTFKKIPVILFCILIIISIIILAIKKKFDINNFLSDLQNQTGFLIKFEEESKWDIYPQIYFSNENISISHKESSIFINESKIEIIKSFWPFSPYIINLKTPIINLNGIEIINASIKTNYKNNIITINEFSGNLIEGQFKIIGMINLVKQNYFELQGNFNNISLNTILQQTDIAVWDRLKIKLSSNNFNITGYAENNENFIQSLKGNATISGSVYLITTDEERFGAALLSLLVEKLPSISSMSKSVNFIISSYGNIPTSVSGNLNINNGKISANNININNNYSKSSMNASLDLLNSNIDGKIIFFEEDKVFLETLLKGNVNKPEILVGGEIFNNNKDTPRDIKKIFEEGINSLVDKLLQIND